MVKVFLRLEGLAVALCAVLAYAGGGGGWAPFLIFLLLPDMLGLVPFLAALQRCERRPAPAGRPARGQGGSYRGGEGSLLPPGLFVLYNVTHAYFTPLALGLLAWLLSEALYWPLLGWVAHIGLDRSLGYGFKLYPYFRHTHLQLEEPPLRGW
ncbi:MAG TPA: DUF4260 family protein [Thermaerobacter sp.]